MTCQPHSTRRNHHQRCGKCNIARKVAHQDAYRCEKQIRKPTHGHCLNANKARCAACAELSPFGIPRLPPTSPAFSGRSHRRDAVTPARCVVFLRYPEPSGLRVQPCPARLASSRGLLTILSSAYPAASTPRTLFHPRYWLRPISRPCLVVNVSDEPTHVDPSSSAKWRPDYMAPFRGFAFPLAGPD